MSEPPVVAAGAVLWRMRESRLEVCLVHRPRYDDWSLPKGKVDPGEHLLAAAVREVEEETGHRVVLGRRLPQQQYAARGRDKIVHYWAAAADPAAPDWRPNHEVDDVAFLPVGDAIRRLSHPHDAETVTALAEGPLRTSPFVLLRHAKAVNRSSWDGPDPERPLSSKGRADARRLVTPLGALGLHHVITSDAVRCAATVRPFATRHAVPVETEPALSEDGHADEPSRLVPVVQKLLSDDTAAVVCSHRPVLPDLLAAATDRARCEIPSPALPPGGFHVLHHRGGVVVGIDTHEV